MVRRSIAAGGLVLLLILLLVGFRGCLDARKERSFKDYVREARSLAEQSTGQSKELFTVLSEPGREANVVTRENNANGLKVQAEELLERARGLSHPDELAPAHRFLVETLELRRDGVAQVADVLPTALAGRERREGTQRIAARMQFFLASDVVFSQRFLPGLQKPLREEGVLDQVQLPTSQFLPDIDWLLPAEVANRLRGGGGGGDRTATPGLHGTALGTVTLGGQTLSPGGSATIQASGDLTVDIQISNGGESEETDVVAKVSIGRGNAAIQVEETIPKIAAGETQTVKVPLDRPPPTGQNVPITIEVEAVPGEEKTDNNKQEFSAIFTR